MLLTLTKPRAHWLASSTNHPKMKNSISVLAILLLLSCSTKQSDQSNENQLGPEPEAYSFSGKPLLTKSADSVSLAKSDSLVAAVRSKSELSEVDYIDMGRSLVNTFRYKKAIENYSEGIAKFPYSFRLLRHRGHRYLNVRQLDKAIADLNKAEELIRSQSEVFEYDAAGKPGATYQHQIWYHIGLYHFFKKDYSSCATAFEKSLATAKAGNDIAGSSDWLYNAYLRTGQKEKASAVLQPFTPDFAIDDKGYPYFRRLLFYKGLITPEELIDINKPIGDLSIAELTKLCGLANYYAYNGDQDAANIFYKKILDSREWAGWAYASAELDARND